MGNFCPCCPKRDGNYNPYVEEDDDYREYDSPNARGQKKPLVPNSATNTHTSNYPHGNRPPDESTYSPPPIPPPSSRYHTNQDPATQQRNTASPPQPPPQSHPLHQQHHNQQQQSQQQKQQQQQQYTQYSESLYLARQPEQPTDSMLLDSMMKSSFMEKRQQRFDGPMSSSAYGTESGDVNGESSIVDSTFGSGSASTITHNSGLAASTQSPAFAASTQSPAFAASMTTSRSPDFAASTQTAAGLNDSLNTSTSSSVYYDAPGTPSYMMGSVNEGAFEPPQQQSQQQQRR